MSVPAYAAELISESGYLTFTALAQMSASAAGLVVDYAGDELRVGARTPYGDLTPVDLATPLRTCLGLPQSRWTEALDDYFAKAGSIAEMPAEIDLARLRVRIGVAGEEPGSELRPLAPGIALSLVEDLPEVIRIVDARMASALFRMSYEELEAHGRANLARALEGTTFSPFDDTEIPLEYATVPVAEESYLASAALLLDSLGIDPATGALVAMPARDVLVMLRLDREYEALPALLANLTATTRRAFGLYPEPLAPTPYWWHEGVFEPAFAFPPDEEAGTPGIVVAPDGLRERFADIPDMPPFGMPQRGVA